MDEYSDSEDESDDRKNEKSYRDSKRPRLIEDKNGVSRSMGSGRSQLLTSPQPPEPSPITPLPQEDNSNSADAKGNLRGGKVRLCGGIGRCCFCFLLERGLRSQKTS